MNEYSLDYYRACLEAKAPSLSPADADRGQLGYWRTKSGAIAIWMDYDAQGNGIGDKVYHVINRQKIVVTTAGLPEVRGFGFATPVSYDDYLQWREQGAWPGEVPGLGHNIGKLSEFEEWRENIHETCRDIKRWLKERNCTLSTQVDADIAANYRDALRKLCKRGDTLLKSEEEPIKHSLRAIKVRWKEPLDEAERSVKELRDLLSIFLNAERHKAASQAEEAQKQLDIERRQLEEQDIALAYLSTPTPAPEVRSKKVGAGGQLGRKTGLRTDKHARLVNYYAALEFFKDDPVVVELVTRLCQAEARAKYRRTIPGVEYYEEHTAI